MRKYVILLLACLFLGSMAINAQRRRQTKKKVVKVVEDPRIVQMLAATQQVMFIDSMVADRHDFLKHIPLSSECGTIEMRDTLAVFTNELSDHRLAIYFDPADSLCHLSSSDYIGQRWTEPVRVQGIGDASVNCPFVMPDGITLYIAQKGEKSLGGYDIFVTRYDASSGQYLRAENLGMPFTSEANDLFYAIDEKHRLGYFVSDRHQPAGKVCIYVFVPNETRKVYSSESIADEQLRSLARIDRIADTWTNGEERRQALLRLDAARAEAMSASTEKYAGKKRSSELDNLHHQAEVLEKALTIARNYYAKASDADRQTLRAEIIKSERELETLQLEIRQKEKAQRNASHSK